MELDDLKQAWKGQDNKQTKKHHIMELIHQKSTGPIAALKTAYRKQMVFVIAIMSMIIATQGKNVDSISSNILFWTYMGFCLAMITAFFLNYRLTAKMERMDNPVKNNLEQHVAMLEQRLKWQLVGARFVLVFFIILLEVIPHYQHLRMLSTWHNLPALLRFSSYAAFLVLQYFMSRAITQKKFGKHLDRLKLLLQEMK
jgi:hypothetical protein